MGVLEYVGRIGGQCDVITKRFRAKLLDHVPLNSAIVPPKSSGGALGECLFRVKTEHELRLYALRGIVARGIGTGLDGYRNTRPTSAKTGLVGDLWDGMHVRMGRGTKRE